MPPKVSDRDAVSLLPWIAAPSLVLAAVAGWPAACRAAEPHAVGDDPAAIVIALDAEGGFRAPAAGGDDDFVLCVKADGTASIRTHNPPERTSWRMKPEELQGLLQFMLDEQKFASLKSAVGQANPMVADDGVWMMRITADGKTHTVRGPMMTDGKDKESRRRFNLCLQRLKGTMTLVSIGGDAPARRFVAAANEAWLKEWPGQAKEPLTLADIGAGGVEASGAVDLRFVRRRKAIQGTAPAIDGPITCTVVAH